MRNKFYKLILTVLCAMLICTAMAAPTFAAGAGDGSGGGGGAAVPLVMDWCYPANGETNVSTTVIIQCKYSHNVAQDLVNGRNVKQFSLQKKSDGSPVEIEVYTADAQLEFDKRQYIYIRPIKPLANNTVYKLVAKAGIQAKNGMVTAAEQSFEFTTCGSYANFNDSNVESMISEEESQALASGMAAFGKSGDNMQFGGAESDSVSQESGADDVSEVETETEQHGTDSGMDKYLLCTIIIIIALALAACLIKIKLAKKENANTF